MSQPTFTEKLNEVLFSSGRFMAASFKELIFIFGPIFALLAVGKYYLLIYLLRTTQHVANPEGATDAAAAKLTATTTAQSSMFLVNLVMDPIVQALFIMFLLSKSLGKVLSFGQLLTAALPFWITLFQIKVISSFGIFFGLVFLFVVPGLYLLVKLSFAPLVSIIDKQSSFNALKISFEKTTGLFWLIATSFLAISLPAAIIFILVASGMQPTEKVSYLQQMENNFVPYISLDIFMSFISLLYLTVLFRIYMLFTENSLNQQES